MRDRGGITKKTPDPAHGDVESNTVRDALLEEKTLRSFAAIAAARWAMRRSAICSRARSRARPGATSKARWSCMSGCWKRGIPVESKIRTIADLIEALETFRRRYGDDAAVCLFGMEVSELVPVSAAIEVGTGMDEWDLAADEPTLLIC